MACRWEGGRRVRPVSPGSWLPKGTGSWQEQAWELGRQMRVDLLCVRHGWTNGREGQHRETACTSREQVWPVESQGPVSETG